LWAATWAASAEQSLRKREPEGAVFNYCAIAYPTRLASDSIQPSQIEPIEERRIELEALTEMVKIASASEADAFPACVCERDQKFLLPGRSHSTDHDLGTEQRYIAD
jgi:hypothetical protein